MSTTPDNVQSDAVGDSPYIRTYAKDLAALSGKGAPPRAQRPVPAPEPLTQTTDGVTLAEVDESLITQANAVKGEEAIDLSDAATAGPTSVFEKIGRAPAAQPTPTVPTSLAPSLDKEREAILDRLKIKAKVAPAPAPTPVFDRPAEPVHPLPPVQKAPPRQRCPLRLPRRNRSTATPLISRTVSTPRRLRPSRCLLPRRTPRACHGRSSPPAGARAACPPSRLRWRLS